MRVPPISDYNDETAVVHPVTAVFVDLRQAGPHQQQRQAVQQQQQRQSWSDRVFDREIDPARRDCISLGHRVGTGHVSLLYANSAAPKVMDKGNKSAAANGGMMSQAKDWFFNQKLNDSQSSSYSSSSSSSSKFSLSGGSYQSQMVNAHNRQNGGNTVKGDSYRNMNTWMPTSL